MNQTVIYHQQALQWKLEEGLRASSIGQLQAMATVMMMTIEGEQNTIWLGNDNLRASEPASHASHTSHMCEPSKILKIGKKKCNSY